MTLGIALGAGIGGAALSWSVSLGQGRAPGLQIFDLAVVGAALVGLALTATMPTQLGADSALPAISGDGAGEGGSRSRRPVAW